MLTLSQAIRETIAWAGPRIDLANLKWSLRSVELRPDAEFGNASNPGFFNQSSYIRQVAEKRSALLSNRDWEVPIYGKLLLVDYELTNHNEVTEIVTKGFFDWADNPPWDLWVGEYDSQLLAWIPPELIEIVRLGDSVECMGMFQWVEYDELKHGATVA